MTYGEQFLWWIAERYRILQKKQAGDAPPWSADTTFQTVYFCNVRREDDKVTKFIRDFYWPYSGHSNLIYNYVFARMINWPETIQRVGYLSHHNPGWLKDRLEDAKVNQAKVWGGAYLITTHGVPMAKATYLVDCVLQAVDKGLGAPSAGSPSPALPPTLDQLHGLLMQFEGLGSFLAAQVVADVKNTEGHPLRDAPDWWTFVAHGPGSLRGASWVIYGNSRSVSPAGFAHHFQMIRDYVDARWPEGVPVICNQDLQNCLCEFDKYCRVSTGVGRSKRNYDGIHPR